ncbi:MAG: tetratricopeptide repeat protein [bacterium]
MENLGLNNDVLVGGRKFHVQTNYSDIQQQVISKVFLDGQVIDSKELTIEGDTSQENIEANTQQLHQQLITEMEVLYYICEKVKTVRHATSSNKLGLLFLQRNLLKECIEQFNLALEIEPQFAEVYANLGKALMMSNSYSEAVEVLNRGVEVAPSFADIRNYLGIAYLYERKFESSIDHLLQAIKLNENYIGAHFHLGVSYLAQSLSFDGEPRPSSEDIQGKALYHFDLAAKRVIDRQIPTFRRIMDLISKQSYKEAVDEFLNGSPKEMLTHFTNIENEFYLKFMYGGKGKDDAFIAEYVQKLQDIITDHPHYADVRNSLGVANLIQCRNLFLKSLEEFRTALKINPNFKKAEKNLKLAENDGKGFLILLRAILK